MDSKDRFLKKQVLHTSELISFIHQGLDCYKSQTCRSTECFQVVLMQPSERFHVILTTIIEYRNFLECEDGLSLVVQAE